MMLAVLAALSGAIAVAAGAMGSHWAGDAARELLKTGSHYQLVHAVAALVALKMEARGPAWLFVIGGVLFAGSLYGLATIGWRWLGPITPIGGTLLIGGWLWLAWSAART